MSKKSFSKIPWKTKNLSLKLVKNPISRSSAKMKRSAFVQPKRKNIFRSTSIKNHPPKNLSGISRKKMFPNTERKSTTVVSSVRNAIILLETALTSLPKLFVSYSIFNILHYYLKMKMLNQTFLNSQNKMTRLLSLSQNLLILIIFQ